MFDAETCYRAHTAKDSRFDGLFFLAVKTTGIYCRPVCPARPPLVVVVALIARALEYEPAAMNTLLQRIESC